MIRSAIAGISRVLPDTFPMIYFEEDAIYLSKSFSCTRMDSESFFRSFHVSKGCGEEEVKSNDS